MAGGTNWAPALPGPALGGGGAGSPWPSYCQIPSTAHSRVARNHRITLRRKGPSSSTSSSSTSTSSSSPSSYIRDRTTFAGLRKPLQTLEKEKTKHHQGDCTLLAGLKRPLQTLEQGKKKTSTRRLNSLARPKDTLAVPGTKRQKETSTRRRNSLGRPGEARADIFVCQYCRSYSFVLACRSYSFIVDSRSYSFVMECQSHSFVINWRSYLFVVDCRSYSFVSDLCV